MPENKSKIDNCSSLQLGLNKAIVKSFSVGDIVKFNPGSSEARGGLESGLEIELNEQFKVTEIESFRNSWPVLFLIGKNGERLNTRMVEYFTKT